MAKGYDAERRRLAYRVWREAHRNATEALRILKRDYGWPLSRTTFFGWMEEEGWGARADAADADAQRETEARELGRTGILRALLRQKDRYEAYFAELEGKGEMDHPAMSAYTQLLRVIDTYQRATVDREAEAQAAKPRPGGLSEEALAEIETKLGMR